MSINSASPKWFVHASDFCATVGLALPAAPPDSDEFSGSAGLLKAEPTAVASDLCSLAELNIAVECPDQ